MSEIDKVWVAFWFIDWDHHSPSFGVVGVATTEEGAEQLFADLMVDQFQATTLDRGAYPDAQTWLEAIAQSSEELSDAGIEFFVEPKVVN